MDVVAESEYMVYRDVKQPTGLRVRDLLSRMTVEEKIGQMTQIDRSVATQDIMKTYSIGKPFAMLDLHVFGFVFLCLVSKPVGYS